MSKQPKDSDELKHHRELYVSSCAAHGALNMPAGLHYTAGWNDSSEILDAVAKVASNAEKLVTSQRDEIAALKELCEQMANAIEDAENTGTPFSDQTMKVLEEWRAMK